MRTMPTARDRRVVITGLGTVNALGTHPGPFWRNLVAGRVGARACAARPALGEPARTAYPVAHADIAAQDQRGRAARLAARAAASALDDAGLGIGAHDPRRAGVALGTGHGDTGEMEEQLLDATRPRAAGDGFQSIVDELACRWRLWGRTQVVATACSSSLYALATAADWIRTGELDLVLAGGTEALAPSLTLFFGRLFERGGDLCRPFDRDRSGTVLGEGAAMLVLESAEHAARRGARAKAIVRATALGCDAYDVTRLNVDGIAGCMSSALADARLEPEQIDHLSAHGSGTRLNDAGEAKAIHAVYGCSARRPVVSAIKGMIGHTSGASGAIAVAAGVLSLQHDTVPPLATLRVPDPECDLDLAIGRARRTPVRAVQVNAFGFGGANASTVLAAPELA